jgi:hypothetical protein
MILLPHPVFVLAFLYKAAPIDVRDVIIPKLGTLIAARNLLLGL